MHLDSPFARALSRLADLVGAGLLWAVASLPLVTLPAATTGLCALADHWARGDAPPVARTFFDGFRARPLRGLAVGAALAAAGLLVVLNASYGVGAEGVPLRTAVLVTAVALGLVTALAATFAFPLLALTDDGPRALLRNALLLAAANPLATAVAWTAAVAAAALSFAVPWAIPLVAALTATLIARLTRHALSRVPPGR